MVLDLCLLRNVPRLHYVTGCGLGDVCGSALSLGSIKPLCLVSWLRARRLNHNRTQTNTCHHALLPILQLPISCASILKRYCAHPRLLLPPTRAVTMSAQPQAPAGQQQQLQLLKVEDVPKLLSLNDDLKQKYKPIFQQLWSVMHSKTAGTPEHNQARAKLQEFSQRLIAQERVSQNLYRPCAVARH